MNLIENREKKSAQDYYPSKKKFHRRYDGILIIKRLPVLSKGISP